VQKVKSKVVVEIVSMIIEKSQMIAPFVRIDNK